MIRGKEREHVESKEAAWIYNKFYIWIKFTELIRQGEPKTSPVFYFGKRTGKDMRESIVGKSDKA